MRLKNLKKTLSTGHRVIVVVTLCLFALGLIAASAQKKRRKAVDDRVYLLHADELKYDIYGPNPDAQIVKGRVSFSHQGARLTCDSAYFYQASNSVRAFGHVRFKQGDTLSLTCERAWYDGQQEMMEARGNVVLNHRRQTLYTDSLNYDRLYQYAYYFNGGRMVDGNTRLSSDWGEYHTDNRMARFNMNVQLQTPKNRVMTDTLYYDSQKSEAHIVGRYTPDNGRGEQGPSIVKNGKTVIHTTDGYFNTHTDESRLYGRSTVIDQKKTIVADTLLYSSKTGYNRGLGNVVYVDSLNKNSLTCGYVEYNEKQGRGFATRRALAIDYSQKDTLYLHADTIRLESYHLNTDSVFRKVFCYHKVRIFRADLQGVCDSMVYSSKDSCMTMYEDPIIWSDHRQLLGEIIKVYMNDSTVRLAEVRGQALSVEAMPDSVHFNQVSSKDMFAYFKNGELHQSDAVGNVQSIFFPFDDKDSTLIGLNYIETDTMKMYIGANKRLQRIWMPKAEGVLYPMTQIPPNKLKLERFAWFEDIRPKDKDDVFNWRGKKKGSEIMNIIRHEAPIQSIGNVKPKPVPEKVVDKVRSVAAKSS